MAAEQSPLPEEKYPWLKEETSSQQAVVLLSGMLQLQEMHNTAHPVMGFNQPQA